MCDNVIPCNSIPNRVVSPPVLQRFYPYLFPSFPWLRPRPPPLRYPYLFWPVYPLRPVPAPAPPPPAPPRTPTTPTPPAPGLTAAPGRGDADPLATGG